MFTDDEWEAYSRAQRDWIRVCASQGATLIEVNLALQPGHADPNVVTLTMGGPVDVSVAATGSTLMQAIRNAADDFARAVAAVGGAS